ncbi:Methyltransferase domain-containing protein [Parafrankia irregularis]|uniref:Methyltransferase domain-containing protein n=2 Tax=Frankiaceae TaxID=74712 RepID=A0A0S4QD23_9ACTN|nr:Methyltransferase domain-containing protein [Parafrankia irregularis]
MAMSDTAAVDGAGGPELGPGGRPSRWASLHATGGTSGTNDHRSAAASGGLGERYERRFAELAAAGMDVHGEAALCAALVPPGGRILDAGCGTGRVAIRLAELGYACTGVDVDPSMLARARAASDSVTWVLADLVDLADLDGQFDLVVAAGNVIPLLAEGSEARVVRALAERLRPGGLLVAGFGLDAAHLPLLQAPFGLAEYDSWCAQAGLALERRLATWEGAPSTPGDGYAVSIHRRS